MFKFSAFFFHLTQIFDIQLFKNRKHLIILHLSKNILKCRTMFWWHFGNFGHFEQPKINNILKNSQTNTPKIRKIFYGGHFVQS